MKQTVSGFDVSEMGIAINSDHPLAINPGYYKHIPEALSLVEDLAASITAILNNAIKTAFTSLRTKIHDRPLYVLFEPQLGCNPLTDHQTPKDVYPIFSSAITSAESSLETASISMIVDELREKIVGALSYEVREKNTFKAKAEDALGKLAALQSKLETKEKIIQQITQTKLDEHNKLIAEITLLREQAFMKRRFGDRYKPDNMERADDGQSVGQGLNNSLLGSTGEFAGAQGSQANRMIREQLTSVLTENKDLKLKLEATSLVQKRVTELESANAALKVTLQQMETENKDIISGLQSDLKEKMATIATYQENEFTLNTSIQELTRQLKTSEKKRATSAEPTSRSDVDLSRENAELRSKVYELQEKLMMTSPVEESDTMQKNDSLETALQSQEELLHRKTEEVEMYRKKLEEAGLLNAPVEAFIKLSEHNSAMASLQSTIESLESRNRSLVETTEQLQRQIDDLIENEAAEINNVLEANELLHKQKLKNAVEAAVCIDGFNESIQAAKNAILNFNDVGCQVPDKRSKKGTTNTRSSEEDIDDKEDAEASRIRRAIDAARKIYANRLPSMSGDALSYDVSSVDEVFKQLFDTAKNAKTQLIKKHQDDLQQEAESLMKNLKLHNKIASVISGYTQADTKRVKDPVKLMSKAQLREVLCEGVELPSSDPSEIEEEEGEKEEIPGANDQYEVDDNGVEEDIEADAPPDAPSTRPSGPVPKGRKWKSSVNKSKSNKSARSTTSTLASSSTRPGTHKSGTRLSDTTNLRASEVGDMDAEKDFFRASVAKESVKEVCKSPLPAKTVDISDAEPGGVAVAEDGVEDIKYCLTDDGKRAAVKRHPNKAPATKKARKPHMVIRLIKDKLSGDICDELGRPVVPENLYVYGYCLDDEGNLVFYGVCPVSVKDPSDTSTILRKFQADENGNLVLPDGRTISRDEALRFGYKGPARDGKYVYTGQPADLYDQIMRLSPDSVSFMTQKILGLDIEYDDIIADFNIKLDLDDVTQKPYVYLDAPADGESPEKSQSALPGKRIDEFLQKVDPESLKIPEEDAFKVGILPDANGDYQYARPVLHLLQVDDSTVVDPQGNEIPLDDALAAGYSGPHGPKKEYYYLMPVPAGETRTCTVAPDNLCLKITINNDPCSSYDVPIEEAYKHGFLPNANGDYNYAGNLPYLREQNDTDEHIYDLLDKSISRVAAEKHGYMRHTDGRYYYVGADNVDCIQAPEDNPQAQSTIDICESSFTERSDSRPSTSVTCPGRSAEITLLYDKDIELFVNKDTGHLVDSKEMLNEYGYLLDNKMRAHFVGVGNPGIVLDKNFKTDVQNSSQIVIIGLDDKMHVYKQGEIEEYYENNVEIVPKHINVVKLQKKLELNESTDQLMKMTAHMKNLEKWRNQVQEPSTHRKSTNGESLVPEFPDSSHSSGKVSILADYGVAKSTVIDAQDLLVQQLTKNATNDQSMHLQVKSRLASAERGAPNTSMVIQELLDEKAATVDPSVLMQSMPGQDHTVVHMEASDVAVKTHLDTLQNCTIVDETSLGTDLARLPKTPKRADLILSHQSSHRTPKVQVSATPSWRPGRQVAGLVVTNYGAYDEGFLYPHTPSQKLYVDTPGTKGRTTSQNILKSVTIAASPYRTRFDRQAGIVFDEQTNKVLGHVNKVTGDIEDNNGRTVGHVELTSHTLKTSGDNLLASDKQWDNNAKIRTYPSQHSVSHDLNHMTESLQSDPIIEFVESLPRSKNVGNLNALQTSTRLATSIVELPTHTVKGSVLSLQRSVVDPRSGRATRKLGRTESPVLVVLQDPDDDSDSNKHIISTIEHTITASPRGESAPTKGSNCALDTEVREDSVVSMYDANYPGIEDRTTLEPSPSRVVRTTSRHAIAHPPPVNRGIHNPASSGSTSLRINWRPPASATEKPTQSLLHPESFAFKARNSVNRTSSVPRAAKTTDSSLVARTQSVRARTDLPHPSIMFPGEVLPKPGYRDTPLQRVFCTQVVLVPDDSKMLGIPSMPPLNILQNITNKQVPLDEATRSGHGSIQPTRSRSPVKKAATAPTLQAPRVSDVRSASNQLYSKPLIPRVADDEDPPRSSSNVVSFTKQFDTSVRVLEPLPPIVKTHKHVEPDIEDMCAPKNSLKISLVESAKTALLTQSETDQHEVVSVSSVINSFNKQEQETPQLAPESTHMPPSRRVLLPPPPAEGAAAPPGQSTRIVHLVQADLAAVGTGTAASVVRRAFPRLEAAGALDANGLAINTSPQRRHK